MRRAFELPFSDFYGAWPLSFPHLGYFQLFSLLLRGHGICFYPMSAREMISRYPSDHFPPIPSAIRKMRLGSYKTFPFQDPKIPPNRLFQQNPTFPSLPAHNFYTIFLIFPGLRTELPVSADRGKQIQAVQVQARQQHWSFFCSCFLAFFRRKKQLIKMTNCLFIRCIQFLRIKFGLIARLYHAHCI